MSYAICTSGDGIVMGWIFYENACGWG